jgi:hypothetical protein
MPNWISGIIAVIGALSARKAAKEQKRADRKREANIVEQKRVADLDAGRSKQIRRFQISRFGFGYGSDDEDTGSRT